MSDDIGFRHDLYVKKKRKIGEYEFWITQSLVSPIFHTIHFRTEIKNNIYIKQYEINIQHLTNEIVDKQAKKFYKYVIKNILK